MFTVPVVRTQTSGCGEDGPLERGLRLGRLGGDDLMIEETLYPITMSDWQTILAPSRAARRAMARPMPREAPVMNYGVIEMML